MAYRDVAQATSVFQMNSLALYGGTFDPIHHGHLILARDAMERMEISRVIFLPAQISPHKLDRPPSPPEIRLSMVSAAISADPSFSVDPRELARTGPSFTIDTAREYREEFPETRLFYFIGDDNLPELHTWKDIDELQTLVDFVILSRTGIAQPVRYPIISRNIEISSTEIRSRVAASRPVHHMVPPAVDEIIRCHRLYQNP
ncbi:MAG: nicotinate-nucleotide adenylyltransferase [Terrimicrobiaceae bacterium]